MREAGSLHGCGASHSRRPRQGSPHSARCCAPGVTGAARAVGATLVSARSRPRGSRRAGRRARQEADTVQTRRETSLIAAARLHQGILLIKFNNRGGTVLKIKKGCAKFFDDFVVLLGGRVATVELDDEAVIGVIKPVVPKLSV